MGTMERILRLMAEKRASDVYLSANAPAMIKINGQTLPINNQLLPADATRTLLAEVLPAQRMDELDASGELNMAYAVEGAGNFRFSAMRQRGSIAAVIRYIARSLIQAVAVALGIATLTFLIVHISGDPTQHLLPPNATREDIRVLKESMGFDRPLIEQYAVFMAGALRGDFGRSFWIARPALDLVMERMPSTILLTFTGLVTALAIGIPIGVMSAVRRYGWIDNLSTAFAMAGQAMPTFWLGLLFIMWFSLMIPILPAPGASST